MIIKNRGVIDITKDQPSSNDNFLIDTNVFLWLTYSRLSLLENKYREYQVDSYPLYLETAIDQSAQLSYSRLSLGEISHFIEKCEHEIYISDNGSIPFKVFRKEKPIERKRVIEEIKNSFGFIKDISQSIKEELDDQSVDTLETDLSNSFLDGTDSYLMNFAMRNGINKVISDDGDFASVKDIYLFTANRSVIRSAQKQGKLVVR